MCYTVVFFFTTKYLEDYRKISVPFYLIYILRLQAMYQQLRLDPYAVHTTFQYGGTEGKRHRLREAMLFLDPPEYYNPPGD